MVSYRAGKNRYDNKGLADKETPIYKRQKSEKEYVTEVVYENPTIGRRKAARCINAA